MTFIVMRAMSILRSLQHSDVLFICASVSIVANSQEQCGDLTLVDAPEGYDKLWNKVNDQGCLYGVNCMCISLAVHQSC